MQNIKSLNLIRTGGGVLSAVRGSLAFDAPLKSDLLLNRGTGSATFTRATMSGTGAVANLGGYVADFEGILRPVALNCAAFEGSRVVTNLILRSEDFSNASWVKEGTTTVASQDSISFAAGTASTNRIRQAIGYLAADRISHTCRITVTIPPASAFSDPTTTISIEMADKGSPATAVPSSGSQTLSYTTTHTGAGASATVSIFSSKATTVSTRFYVQVEDVSGQSVQTAAEYIPTTTVPITKCYPYTLAGIPIPESTLKGYLSEPSAVNLCLQSQTFGTTWAKGTAGETVALSGTAPDGTSTSWKISEDNTIGVFGVYQGVTKAASALPYTFTCYVKAGERSIAYFLMWDGAAVGNRYWFDLSTGQIGSTAAVGAGFTSTSYSIQSVGNSWYKCKMSFTTNTATTVQAYVAMSSANNVFSYQGVTNNGMLFWGAQLEATAYSTSYIPTTTNAVTRAATSLSYPTAGNISGTVGSSFLEFYDISNSGQATGYILSLYPAGSGILCSQFGSTSQYQFYDGTNNSATGVTYPRRSSAKYALKYSGTATKMASNGTLSAGQAFDGDFNASTLIAIGSSTTAGTSVFNGNIKNVRIYSTALTDNQLRAMTS